MKNKFFLFSAAFFLVLCVTFSFGRVNARAEKCDSEIVVEATSGRVLYEKNADEKRPIASLTKIVTAITAIENCELGKTVEVPKECCGVEGSSIYLKPGERLTVEELLYGLMLRSGNDCAETIAVAVSGSVEKFAALMNAVAKKAGAENSNFVNPHGLHDDNHYSTARDMAKITAYCMKNDKFKEIVSTESKVIAGTEEGKRYLKNKNKLLFSYKYCNGVKTGYTKKAGRCLASAAVKDGMQLVGIVLDCGPMYENSEKNFEEAFAKYKMVTPADKDAYRENFRIKNAACEAAGYIKENFSYPVTEEEADNIRVETELAENLSLPLKKDEKIGIMKIYLRNQLLFSQNIYTIIDIDEKYDFFKPFREWTRRLK